MSLVITSNQDNENAFSQAQSVYSAFSYRNEIGSTYSIPPNSQVCLQSAKVNLDGRDTVTLGNSVYYDFLGKKLEAAAGGTKLSQTISYPIVQRINSNACGQHNNQILEVTTDEMAAQIVESHKEYHPNLKDQFNCSVKRNASTFAFEGYEFTYDQNTTAPLSNIPTSFEKFYHESEEKRFAYDNSTGVFTRNDYSENADPCVGIGLGRPLSLAGSNRKMRVDITSPNASGVDWAVGLSRDIPLTTYPTQQDAFVPPYWEIDDIYSYGYGPQPGKAASGGDLGLQDFFADYCVHRDTQGFLRLTHSVFRNTGNRLRFIREEVKYYENASSAFVGATAYNISTNASEITKVEFEPIGEEMVAYLVETPAGKPEVRHVLCRNNIALQKTSYFKPIAQTTWCLHPVLFIGANASSKTRELIIDEFAGVTLGDYDSRAAGKCGWFEEAMLSGSRDNGKFLDLCQEVDKRGIIRPDLTSATYVPLGLNASDGVAYTPTMIVDRNTLYKAPLATAFELLGFTGRDVVNEGTIVGSKFTYSSDDPTSTKTSGVASIFIRLNGFGQQVLNARTKNKSTILAQLPTADTQYDRGGRIFYEPNRDVWLDLNNPYEITTSDFSLDLVYSNEQYAKVCQGQTIIVLYFREKPNMLSD